jgi:hypothetical protein
MYFSAKVGTGIQTKVCFPPPLSSAVQKLHADVYKVRVTTDGERITSYIKC